MSKKTGSIVLGTIRYFTGVVPSKQIVTVEMLSANLSANTTFNLQISAGGTNYANAQENGEDITGTLVDDTVNVLSFAGNPGDYFKILFAGVTTGTVDYVINAV